MIQLIKAINYNDFVTIEKLAREILPEVYNSMIHDDHIFYLIEKSHSAKAIDDHVLNKNYQYYLITNNDSIVGYFGIEFINDSLNLSKLYLLKAYRSMGIGTIVLSFLNKVARSFDIYKIELTVHKQNQKSIDFYSKNGFIITDSLFHQFENGHTLHGFQMIKVLNRKEL